MKHRSNRLSAAALTISILALTLAMTGVGEAARKAIVNVVSKPKPNAVLKLDKKGKFPAKAIPTVSRAKIANGLSDAATDALTPSCAPTTVDLGTWCLMASPYPLANDEIGKNDYAFATQKCVSLGGYLPTAGQLFGAAAQVKLNSTIDDDQLTASTDLDPSDGLKDRREMSSTLITTAAGSSAAGSQGVTDGSKGDPHQVEPDPTPFPANPMPGTLQYVTVYDNHDKGGFAGGAAVSQPEAFRCAFEKVPGAAQQENG